MLLICYPGSQYLNLLLFSDDFGAKPAKKTKASPKKAPTKSKAPAKKKTKSDDFLNDDSDDDMELGSSPPAPRTTTGRARKPVQYNIDDSDESDF